MEKKFLSEFPNPSIYHMTLAWDSEEEGQISEFVKDGFRLEKGIILTATAREIHLPRKFHPSIQVLPPQTDQDWEDSIQTQAASGDDSLSREDNQEIDFIVANNNEAVLAVEVKSGRIKNIPSQSTFKKRGIACPLLVVHPGDSGGNR